MDLIEIATTVIELSKSKQEYSDEIQKLQLTVETMKGYLEKLDEDE